MITDQYLSEHFFDVVWYFVEPGGTDEDIRAKFEFRNEQITAKKGDPIPNINALKSIDQGAFEAWQRQKRLSNYLDKKDRVLLQVLRYISPAQLPATPTHTEAEIIAWLDGKI